MKTDPTFGLRLLAPGLVLFSAVLLGSPEAIAQSPGSDPLSDAIAEAEARRDAAHRELELRRAEYRDALQRAEQLDRRQVARPSFADPLGPYGSGAIGSVGTFGMRPNPAMNARPYVLRQVPSAPIAGPIGRGGIGGYGPTPYPPMSPIGSPFGYGPGYGYGYGAPGGLDIPFGLGLGGLSIRW